jgi:hypothetical protein
MFVIKVVEAIYRFRQIVSFSPTGQKSDGNGCFGGEGGNAISAINSTYDVTIATALSANGIDVGASSAANVGGLWSAAARCGNAPARVSSSGNLSCRFQN